MADTGTSFRRAYQAVVDRTPPAPGWEAIDAPPAPVRRPARRPVPRWVLAAAAAGLLLAVLGGGALLGLDGDPGPASTTPAAAVEAPPATGTPTPTAADAVAADPQPVPLAPRTARASSELSEDFKARYLIDGTPRAWNDDSLRGEGAVLTFWFAEPVDLDYIVIHNLTEPERFARNYRIAEFELLADGEPILVATVPDAPGPHPYDVGRRATEVTLGVLEVYPAEAFDGSPPFEELAVAEVEFQGSAPAP